MLDRKTFEHLTQNCKINVVNHSLCTGMTEWFCLVQLNLSQTLIPFLPICGDPPGSGSSVNEAKGRPQHNNFWGHLHLCVYFFFAISSICNNQPYLMLRVAKSTVMVQVGAISFTVITCYLQSHGLFVRTVCHHFPFSAQPWDTVIYIENASGEANLCKHLPFLICRSTRVNISHSTLLRNPGRELNPPPNAPSVRPNPHSLRLKAKLEVVWLEQREEYGIWTSSKRECGRGTS